MDGGLGRAATGMRWAAGMLLALGLMLPPWPSPAPAHPGKLDEYGGHFSERTNQYHYHRPRAEMATRKREFLTWKESSRSGELHGKVVKIERPDAFWLRVPYRPAYEEIGRAVTGGSRRNKDQLVRIWFLHASAEASANRGAVYNKWFHKKVVYELDRKLRGKEVVVQFRITRGGERVFGMVLMGEENINLWLVLSGWSYYLLGQGENPFDKEFRQAEALARKSKAGLWKKAR